jgi:hypothetical protein
VRSPTRAHLYRAAGSSYGLTVFQWLLRQRPAAGDSSWLAATGTTHWISEISATLRAGPGGMYLYDSFTDETLTECQ